MCIPANNGPENTQILAHSLWHTYHQAQNSLRFNNTLPLTLNNGTKCNTTSIARPRYSYTSRRALTDSGDRINIQFPTSHYNSIKANLLLPLEHCFGWMLSGGPTSLWVQLRTFKHIKIFQALHCPDYCLNIICFDILSHSFFLLNYIHQWWFFFPLEGIQGRASKYLFPFMQKNEIAKWRVNHAYLALSHKYPAVSLQSATYCMGQTCALLNIT